MDRPPKPGDLIRITDTSQWDRRWQFAQEITWRIVRVSSMLVLEPIMNKELPGGVSNLNIMNNERNRNNIVIL